MPLNVLIYAGAGTSADAVRHALLALRRLLAPNFAVSTITAAALLAEPWPPTCALLVVPGGADLPYCAALDGAGNRRIAQYVRGGGAYLGLCAGGYYGAARVEFERGDRRLAVVGRRELAFFPGTCRGAAWKGFEYASEAGARAAAMRVEGADDDGFACYFNGGGVFVDADALRDRGVEVMARYRDELDVDAGAGNAAVVYCKVGDGNVVLTGIHPEYAAQTLPRGPR